MKNRITLFGIAVVAVLAAFICWMREAIPPPSPKPAGLSVDAIIGQLDLHRRTPFRLGRLDFPIWFHLWDSELAESLRSATPEEYAATQAKARYRMSAIFIMARDADDLIGDWTSKWENPGFHDAIGDAFFVELGNRSTADIPEVANGSAEVIGGKLWTEPAAADGLDVKRIRLSAMAHKREFFDAFIASNKGWETLHPSKKPMVDVVLALIGYSDHQQVKHMLALDASGLRQNNRTPPLKK